MANQLLEGLGVDVSAAGVAGFHGGRDQGGILDGWLVDSGDEVQVASIEALDIAARSVPLWMTDVDTTRQLAVDALAFAADVAKVR
jgi:LPPG:FO 2-phospho-L-lactate transferase